VVAWRNQNLNGKYVDHYRTIAARTPSPATLRLTSSELALPVLLALEVPVEVDDAEPDPVPRTVVLAALGLDTVTDMLGPLILGSSVDVVQTSLL
jgi:hypothetical protein